MTYAVGGTIQAADFNGFVGGNPANVSGQLNPMWAIGTGNAGLGQTAVANVSAGATVAATNWASLINNLNAMRKNQSGASYTNLTVPTAGANITYLSTLSTELTNAYNNRGVSASSVSALASATKTLTVNVAANTAGVAAQLFTITFSTVDAARYFFNAGGYIATVYGSFTNTGGNTRGTSLQTLAQTNFAQKNLYSTFFSARSGTGGTATIDFTTGKGYYALPSTTTTNIVCNILSTSYYSGDYFRLEANAVGGAGSYGANGNIIYLNVTVYSGTTNAYNTAINVSVTFQCQVGYTQTTYLTNSWGTATIA